MEWRGRYIREQISINVLIVVLWLPASGLYFLMVWPFVIVRDYVRKLLLQFKGDDDENDRQLVHNIVPRSTATFSLLSVIAGAL